MGKTLLWLTGLAAVGFVAYLVVSSLLGIIITVGFFAVIGLGAYELVAWRVRAAKRARLERKRDRHIL